MQFEDLLDELTVGDLQEQHRQLAVKIGLDALIAMSKSVGGTQQYIPMVYELTKEVIYRKIREEFTGGNIQALAVKYLVSESTVRRVLQEQITKKRYEPFEGQLALSDG